MDIDNISLFMHWIITIFNTMYAFFIKNKYCDYLYIFIIYGIVLQWTFLNGECILSYYYKKRKNKDYKFGENLDDSEVISKFGKYKDIVSVIIIVMMIINMNIVFKRNNISNHLFFMFAFGFLSYGYGVYIFKNHHINKNFIKFNEISKIYFIIYGIILYVNIKQKQ
jgi:hypothetical protein